MFAPLYLYVFSVRFIERMALRCHRRFHVMELAINSFFLPRFFLAVVSRNEVNEKEKKADNH